METAAIHTLEATEPTPDELANTFASGRDRISRLEITFSSACEAQRRFLGALGVGIREALAQESYRESDDALPRTQRHRWGADMLMSRLSLPRSDVDGVSSVDENSAFASIGFKVTKHHFHFFCFSMRSVAETSIAILLLTTTAAAMIRPVPVEWFGTWRLNRAQSVFTGQVIRIARAPHGFRFDFGAVAFTVGDDGRDYPTVPTRTTSIKRVRDRQWLRIHKINGREVDRSILTVSVDGRILRIRAIEPADHSDADEYLKRIGSGLGLAGVWQSTALGKNVVPEKLTIERRTGGVVRLSFPDDGQYYDLEAGGARAPLRGPRSVPGVALRLEMMRRRTMHATDYVNGKPYSVDEYVLSRDGTLMVDTTWQAAEPTVRQRAVYERSARSE